MGTIVPSLREVPVTVGENVLMIRYGQTGSGKSHTMVSDLHFEDPS
jgi:Tfp pilus assembly ATPase PilU